MDLRYMWVLCYYRTEYVFHGLKIYVGLCYYRTEYVLHGLKIYVGSVLLQDRVRPPWT